ncbi:hypothetical protein N7445_009155 [Penicillium cf. griseofulvum]|nr:hypothetical protein N7445_009155 [Penicillium cf. griseofulvum]
MHPTSHVPPDTPGSPQDDFAKPLDSEHETIDPPQSANEYGLEYKIRAIDRLWHKYKARGKLGDLPKDYATSPATPTTLSKQRPAMINEISCAVINCLQSLNKLLSGMQFSEHQLDVPLVLWHDELGRLRVWAANIGAHKTGQSSLDHRLRDASDIKRQILQLLKRLQRVIEHLKGTLDVPSAPIEEDLSAPGDEEHESEIYSIYNALRETINDLFQLSVIIRRPAQRDRFLGTKRADAVMFEPFDRQHVNDKYPRADPRILDRLGLAISKRRAVLRYRERHHIKLGQGLNAILDDDTQSAMLSETIATEFANLSETAGNDIWETRSSISQTSYAQTILHVDGDPFECPYCFEIITIEKETAWAHHVFSDLMPYICIFLDCSTPHRLYDSRREWYFHLQSQHSIADDSSVCPDCPLCLSSISSGRQFERHVGRHLQELALFALPRFGPEEDDLRAFTESQEALEESEYEDESDIPDISQGYFRPAEDLTTATPSAQ